MTEAEKVWNNAYKKARQKGYRIPTAVKIAAKKRDEYLIKEAKA